MNAVLVAGNRIVRWMFQSADQIRLGPGKFELIFIHEFVTDSSNPLTLAVL